MSLNTLCFSFVVRTAAEQTLCQIRNVHCCVYLFLYSQRLSVRKIKKCNLNIIRHVSLKNMSYLLKYFIFT